MFESTDTNAVYLPGSNVAPPGVSSEAFAIYRDSTIVDLHIDSYIWVRAVGYDVNQMHSPGLLDGRFFRQVDLPRLHQAGIHGATWVITTNVFRSNRERPGVLDANLHRIEQELQRAGLARVVSNYTEFLAARRMGQHAAFLGVQGGNALGSPAGLSALSKRKLLRVTLVHMTPNRIAGTSAQVGLESGLGPDANTLIESLNEHKVFVDLAHISRSAFWAVLDVHSRDVPPIITHTGVCGVRDHWRNVTDEQLRAIADRGGVIGIMYHSWYLRRGYFRGRADDIAHHIVHALTVAGEDAICLGSDWDGAIVTPRDMPTCLELPRLVQALLGRGVSTPVIRKVLGENFLRLLREVRP
jgi:membrane dipeptidase